MAKSGRRSDRKDPYWNIKHKLFSILFSISLICLSTSIWGPNLLYGTITLNLSLPEYSSCGNVSINGGVGTSTGTITRLSWDWDDGTVADSWFPATHHYRANGLYTVTVTAFCSTGETQSTSTTVDITNAEDPLCSYALFIYPTIVILRGGNVSQPLRVELRNADGFPVSIDDKSVSFSSSNPAIVQVDSTGVVSGTGFGQAEITVTAEGFPLTAKASVFAGEFRLEPPILLLSPNGQPTGQLSLKVANADGSQLNLSGRNVTYSGSNAVAQVDGSGLVTALRPPHSFDETPYITASIDGIPSHNAAVIRVTSDPLNLNMISLQEPNITFYIAQQIGSYNYQQIFQDFDVSRITNIAYQLEEEACGLVPSQGDMQYLANDPGHGNDGYNTIPCGASGNPVRIGTDVDKSIHNSCLIVAFPPPTPQWGIFFHEMGHNFTFASRSFGEFGFSSEIENSNISYIEGLASDVAMYVAQMMSERATQYQIPSNILSTIMPIYHIGSTPDLDAYVNSGAKYSKINPSVVYDIMMVLADKYGFSILPRFYSVFLPPDASFRRFYLNNSDANQATFFVAAMSAAAKTDLRSDFRDKWGFPVDDSSFNEIYPIVKRLVGQSPNPPTGLSASDGTYTDKVRVTWSAPSSEPPPTGYKIFRNTSNNSSGASQIGTSSNSPYDDTKAVAGTTYWYWAKASNSIGDSEFSNGDSGYLASAPNPPTSLSASDGTYTDKVRVTWSAPSSEPLPTGYKIFRNTSNNSSRASQIGTSSASPYDDTKASAGRTYWYWVKAYNSIGDSTFSNGDSGYRRAVPDFVVQSITLNPSSPTAKSSFTAKVVVKNQGTGSGNGGRLDVWVNQPTVQSCGATGDKHVNVGTLAAGARKTFTFKGLSAGLVGSKTFQAFVDSDCQTTELNEENNQATLIYTVVAPDLLVSSGIPTVMPSTVVAGGKVKLSSWTVKNQGMGAAGAFSNGFYLSTDAVITSSDTYLTGNSNTRLAAGAQYTWAGPTLTIPAATPPGNYYIGILVDRNNQVAETNEDNNYVSVAIQVSLPDYIETSVSDPPATVILGRTFSITDTVKNQGIVASTRSSTTRYYLSLDTAKSSEDKLLKGTRSVPILAAGATSTGTVTVKVPSTTTPGNYYLLACSDDTKVVAETDENNNCKASSTKVQITH